MKILSFKICFLLTLAVGPALAQTPVLFDRLDKVKGLENRSITSVVQDDLGFIWFGSQDGLIRFDGYEIKIYKNNLKDKNSIADNNIRALAKDKKGNLWIATQGGGLDKFDQHTEQFIHYKNNPNDEGSISGNAVWSVFVDSKGTIWAGTFSNGLNKLDSATNKFIRINPDDQLPVLAICEDKEGMIWFSSGGINRVDPSNNNLKNFTAGASDPESLSSGGIRALLQSEDGTLWVGAVNGGLFQFDVSSEKFIRHALSTATSFNSIYALHEDNKQQLWIAGSDGIAILKNEVITYCKHLASDRHSLSTNSILALYSDREGTTWVGTEGGGVNKLLLQKKFQTYRASAEKGSLSHSLIRSLYEDKSGRIWVGTQGGGLNVLENGTNTFRKVNLDANQISSIYEDQDGSFWIGSWGSGLFHLSAEEKLLKHYRHSGEEKNSLPDDRIQVVKRDLKGILWVGTENGLSTFDENQNLWMPFKKPLTGNNVQGQAFVESAEGEIWMGTWFGLNRISADRNTVTFFTSDTTKSTSLSSDHVTALYLDNKTNVLWIGTFGGGLNRLDIKTNSVTHFTEEDGLPNNTIYGIRKDNNDNLWMSTNNGLSRFNPTTKVFRNYDATEGLQGNEFYWGAAHSTLDGRMLFGGVNGLNIFDPAEINGNLVAPPIVITSIEIFNKPITIGKGSVLEQSISFTNTLTLRYDQNVLSFQYSALNYDSPEKNLYAYYLENFDKDWNYVGDKRNISYTNLNPGDYVLHVKGSNNDGVWNEKGVTLNIQVVPPYWRTWWFYTLATLAVVGLVYRVIRIRLKSVREEKDKLRITLEEALNKAHNDLDQQKKAIEEEQNKNFERRWMDQSLSSISELLSKSKDDVKGLCSSVLSALVKRCELSAGVIYIFNEEENALAKQASYGITDTSNLITPGTGQVGECFQKRELIVIDNLPENFVRISSGLGAATPKVLVLIPLVYEEICVGVIELASFDQIPPYRIEFIETLSTQMAAAIHITQRSQLTSRLFEESKLKTEEMRVREEELKQNLEEMQAIQEGFMREKTQYEKTIEELRGRLKT
jgi:ligand-binding sensor domain-containing protein